MCAILKLDNMSFVELQNDAFVVAPRLLGCLLTRTTEDGQVIAGKIVETEAYDQSDAASHSYNGMTPRTKIMFGRAGFAYIYFTYGMHYCMNVVTGPIGYGSAVLIRAIEPTQGVDFMHHNRLSAVREYDLTNGPAKLCQAFMIDKHLNGHNLRHLPLKLVMRPPIASDSIIQTTRIGISRDANRPWRFYIKNNMFISKP